MCMYIYIYIYVYTHIYTHIYICYFMITNGPASPPAGDSRGPGRTGRPGDCSWPRD